MLSLFSESLGLFRSRSLFYSFCFFFTLFHYFCTQINAHRFTRTTCFTAHIFSLVSSFVCMCRILLTIIDKFTIIYLFLIATMFFIKFSFFVFFIFSFCKIIQSSVFRAFLNENIYKNENENRSVACFLIRFDYVFESPSHFNSCPTNTLHLEH